MAAPQMTGMTNLGTDAGNRGQALSANSAKDRELFATIFAGEVLTAMELVMVTKGRFVQRSISKGQAANFPVVGRTKAFYMKKGDSLDNFQKAIPNSNVVITIDDYLADAVMIYDLEAAMNEWDFRSEYTRQLGSSLAFARDAAVLAELAKGVGEGKENIDGLGKPVLTTTAIDPTATTAANGTAFIEALVKQRAQYVKNSVPANERVCFTSPEMYSSLLMALSPNASNWQALINPETGTISNVMGFEIIETGHLTAGGAGYEEPDNSGTITQQLHIFPTTGDVTADNVVALTAHRSAVGIASLKEMETEMARRADYKADQIIVTLAEGIKMLRPEASGAIVTTAKADDSE